LALLAPGAVGGVVLLVVAAALAGLLTLTWPRHPARVRALRVAVLTLLVLVAVVKLA
jgi:hypothetical protein